MEITDFDNERMEQITSGLSPMTPEERAFLVEDTPRFEECSETADELQAMNDKDLMNTAYWCWAQYASGQV